ncbi:helix-turn-helix transcriptional regulator [Chamaesiphon sp.]|uniref:helix-turn-helix transcriptional regulator n=1 Tax=Chamaesiphon sp. TaxID=2814140 RepID=UPI0035940BBD
MTIKLTCKEEDELWNEAAADTPPYYDREVGSQRWVVPTYLGRGSSYTVQLHPNCELSICDHSYHRDFQVEAPEQDHPVQFGVMLSSKIVDSYGGVWGDGHTIISGSGIQQRMGSTYYRDRSCVVVDVEMTPDYFKSLFADDRGELPSELEFLVRGNDWQTLIYPQTNLEIQRIAHDIVFCPYQGAAKRLYLQGKVPELVASILAPIIAERSSSKPLPQMKAQTLSRLYAARDILRSRLEHPPSALELAQQVGLSDRTLRRGFRDIFDTTVFGYLTQHRMELAEQLLRLGNVTVAEIANRVGYTNPSHFGEAFKRQFGITPQACLMGKKSGSRG